MYKHLIFDFHQDGGHAWLKVSKDLHNKTNLTAKHISCFSYQDNNNYYLEEDCDATMYLNNLKEQGIKYSLIIVDDGDYSPIRNLSRVEMQNGLLNARQLNLFEEVNTNV